MLDCSIFVQNQKALPRDLDRAEAASLFVAFDRLPVLVPGVAQDFDRWERIPPPDLVITLGVLLI